MDRQKMLCEQDIERLAQVARIALSSEEQAAFCRDLNELFELVSELEELLPKNVEESRSLSTLADLRTDEAEAFSWEPTHSARNCEDGYFSVPAVMEGQ